MKPLNLILALIVSVAYITACNRENTDHAVSTSSVVVFSEAGVSVDVGTDWKQISLKPGPPTCPPMLLRSNCVVGASLFAKQDTMSEVIDAAHSIYVANTNSLKDSWHKVEFATSSGLTGQHISYIETKLNHGNKTLRQRHDFLVQRKDGRVVSISYDAPIGDNADPIQQMIQRSMKLQ